MGLTLKRFIAGCFIWIPFQFVVLLDLVVETYHRIASPMYGLELVERSKYVRIDRHKLPYLGFRANL